MQLSIFSRYCASVIIAAFTVISASAPKPDIQGKVISVGDGDTLTILRTSGDRAIIRLACIDAPEIAQKPWGELARNSLRELLATGRSVRVRHITTDRYRRIVGEVFIDEAFSPDEPVNLTLTRSGQVVVYRQYLRGCDRAKYIEAENSARANKLNFWNQDNPVVPWEYRASRRKK